MPCSNLPLVPLRLDSPRLRKEDSEQIYQDNCRKIVHGSVLRLLRKLDMDLSIAQKGILKSQSITEDKKRKKIDKTERVEIMTMTGTRYGPGMKVEKGEYEKDKRVRS